MSYIRPPLETSSTPPPSPLVICDRLLSLAKDADRAGCAITAEHLLHLAYQVFEEPRPAHA